MPPKTVAMIGAACLTTGWLLASLLTPPVANVQALPERRPIAQAASAQDIEPVVEPLRIHRAEAPVTSTTRRNPFAFGNRRRTSDPPATDPHPVAAPQLEPAVAPVAGPTYWLSGIGISETANGLDRTAVLSDGATVHLVKIGQTLGGYTVIEITDVAVTLADSSGSRYALRLKN